MKPILVERYADNGQLSHYELIDDEGNILWTQSDESPSPSLQEAVQQTSKLPNPLNVGQSPVFSDEVQALAEKILNYYEPVGMKNGMDVFSIDAVGESICTGIEEGYKSISAQQTAPLLTREVFDKIWEAATRWADVGNIDNNPDKETFFTSLNI